MADFFTTLLGDGAKDGSDWANAFDLAGYINQATTSTAGHTFYIFSDVGDYVLTSNVTMPSGATNANPAIIVGIFNKDTMEVSTKLNGPNFVCGSFDLNYTQYKVITGIRHNTSDTQGIVIGNYCKIEDCFASQNSNTRNAWNASNNAMFVNCEGFVTSGSFGSAFFLLNNSSAIGCRVNGGSRGITVTEGLVKGCLINGTTNRGITGTSSNIVDNTIDNCDVAIFENVTAEGDEIGLTYNNIISNNNIGKQLSNVLNPLTLAQDYNNYYNNTIDVTDDGVTEDNSYKGQNSTALDPQYTNAGGGDYTIGTNLKGLGYPGSIDSLNTGYMDIGALQRQEPATPSYPTAGEVAEGVDRGDGVLGTRTDASPNNVLTDNSNYGDPSAQFVPLWTKADSTKYLDGETFGVNGTSETGSFDPDQPSEDDVRLGVVFDSGNKTGNVRVSPVTKVELGYKYDSNDSLTGTLESIILQRDNFEIELNGSNLEVTL